MNNLGLLLAVRENCHHGELWGGPVRVLEKTYYRVRLGNFGKGLMKRFAVDLMLSESRDNSIIKCPCLLLKFCELFMFNRRPPWPIEHQANFQMSETFAFLDDNEYHEEEEEKKKLKERKGIRSAE